MKQVEITSKVVGRGESEGITSAIPSINLSGFAIKSDLLTLEKKFSDFLNVPIIDGTINRWNELETFLAGISEDYNLLSLLNGKADKSYVDTNFVTIAGTEDVTGLHNFVNGLKIGGLPITKKQDDVVYLDANLVVRGGITMYAENEVNIPSILDSLPIASNTALGIASFDSTYFSVDSNGMVTLTSAPSSGASTLGELLNVDASIDATASVDRVLYQPAGSAMWTWRELPKDGVVGNYLPLSGGQMSGHIYMTGAKADSSTANTTQIVFGTPTDNHVCITSNKNGLIINPTTSSTSGQIALYADMNKESFIQSPLSVYGDLFLRSFSTEASSKLFFQRGVIGDIYADWSIHAESGNLYFMFHNSIESKTMLYLTESGIDIKHNTPTINFIRGTGTGDDYNDTRLQNRGGMFYIDFDTTGTGWVQALQLDRAGNLLVVGGITMYSDQRKKTILNHVELSLKQIADAPLIEHYYNSDQDKTTHVGSIAQYWAELNDWFCKLDAEGFYTMEIQNCALASAISIARHLEKYESKTDKTIRKMKKRIQELEEEVEQLKKN